MRYLFLLWYLANGQPDLPGIMPCPDEWHQDIETTTCYKAFESRPKSWNAAESHCQSFGGDLASITSQREQELVVSILNRHGYDIKPGLREPEDGPEIPDFCVSHFKDILTIIIGLG